MNGKKIATAALGATLLIGASASASFAAPHHDGHRPGPERQMMADRLFIYLLKNADANKDGKISKDELVAWEESLFAQIDTNKDGSLTPGELRNFRDAKMEEWRDKMHAEHAGGEKKGPGPDAANKDAPPPPPPGKGGPDDGHHGPRHGGPDHMDGRGPGPDGMDHDGMRPHGMATGLIRMIDTDENGQISKAEANAAVDKLFDRMDRNKDGVISIDDLPNGPF
jgi:Ca2+-binding EF-hand superfamily protein